jgi:hypothetical protein
MKTSGEQQSKGGNMKSGRRSAALAAMAMAMVVAVTAAPMGSAAAYDYPSTNDTNRVVGAPHVEVVSAEPGNVTLRFATETEGYALIEYRVDGVTVDIGNNWVTGGVLNPYVCVEMTLWLCEGEAASVDQPFQAAVTVEVRLAITSNPEWAFDWTTFEVPAAEPAAAGDSSKAIGPSTKAECRKGGWAAFGFGNQGHCVSYVMTSKIVADHVLAGLEAGHLWL